MLTHYIVFPLTNTGARLAGVYLIYTFYAGYMISLSIYQANTAGHTKSMCAPLNQRTNYLLTLVTEVTISYVMYLAYAIGNIIG